MKKIKIPRKKMLVAPPILSYSPAHTPLTKPKITQWLDLEELLVLYLCIWFDAQNVWK